MPQLKFIYRFFFGGHYQGSKKSIWCYDNPKTRFINTGKCFKPGLLHCLKMWKQYRYDSYNYRHDWHYIPTTIWQFIF